MPGGLIEIAAYGSQDIFLTGTPEITFFKVVYRRHTNFSIESIKVNFDDNVEFGSYSVLKVPKVGDLMYKTYLEVVLPEINLFRDTVPSKEDINEAKENVKLANADYTTVTNFMYINRNAYVSAYIIYIAENNVDNATSDMITNIKSSFEKPGNETFISQFRDLLTLTPEVPFTFDEVSMDSIASLFTDATPKTEVFNALSVGIDKSIKTQKFFYDILLSKQKILNDLENPNIKFAWIDRIGHAIIESIEIKIGGNKIDKHYGDWLNIWYELTANRDMESIYYKMIGNVSELTTYDRSIKPSYILKIPLQFWFCRFSGLSIPLISLEYHNVSLHFHFRKFVELCYIESGTNIKYFQVDDGITLEEVQSELGIDITASLLIDYIYLDSPERRRFAQSSHEYLIEQLQILDKTNIIQQKFQFQINNFVHPSKELIWVVQRQSFTENLDGTNQCRWDNYSATVDNKINPISFSSLDFNSYNRIIRLDGNYFNYVQPYETHNTTPSDGINMYSFSIFPEEHQPSGSANFSRFSRITMQLEFTDLLVTNGTLFDPLIIKVYTRNLNILRFVSGFAGIAFTYG
jgi:hypothetical protein